MDAAWAKLNQARGAFLGHHLHTAQEAVEEAWEEAVLKKAMQIRAERYGRVWAGIQDTLQRVSLALSTAPETGDWEKTA